MARNSTPRRKNPHQGEYLIRKQVSDEKYEATAEAIRESGGALGSITLRRVATKTGKPFETVTKHEGRNVTDRSIMPLAPGHVGIELITPVDAHQQRNALEQRANQILAEGGAIPQLPDTHDASKPLLPLAPHQAPVPARAPAKQPAQIRPIGGGWDNAPHLQ